MDFEFDMQAAHRVGIGNSIDFDSTHVAGYEVTVSEFENRACSPL